MSTWFRDDRANATGRDETDCASRFELTLAPAALSPDADPATLKMDEPATTTATRDVVHVKRCFHRRGDRGKVEKGGFIADSTLTPLQVGASSGDRAAVDQRRMARILSTTSSSERSSTSIVTVATSAYRGRRTS